MLCRRVCKSRYDVKIHLQVDHGHHCFHCEMCARSFLNYLAYETHVRTHLFPMPIEALTPEEARFSEPTPAKRQSRVKEQKVFDFLASYDPRFAEFVRDTCIGNGSRLRPDGRLVLHVVCGSIRLLLVLEVDEFQHRHYKVECELSRLEIIQQCHGGPIHVVRYNPDQHNGLHSSMLEPLAKRLQAILDTLPLSWTTMDQITIEYHGYSCERVRHLESYSYERVQSRSSTSSE